jgi:hypothetical protein
MYHKQISESVVHRKIKRNERLGVNRLTKVKNRVTSERIGVGKDKWKLTATAGVPKATGAFVLGRKHIGV